MAKLDWSAFLQAHREAHCVSLEVAPEQDAPTTNLRQLSDTVKRLVREQLKPEGLWAIQLSRQQGVQLLQCAFARLEDACSLARLTRASKCTDSGEWLSHWFIRVNDELLDLLFDRAGPPDKGRDRQRSRSLS
ncbi:MAG: hypothetical protein IKE60_21150 [Reyranella sp.]|jgi:hypothetical protein|uniref:hypothetical protein n=1 Tax=Reyranella sp. TaxID=1929291 RepID=UPI0009642F89|nr:hypothetical protein [Reyranella sp.]MBN9535432.1 hypothetical protein [Alphaproteobacteria bacterium]MBR2817179.1 hypothetical protein [Reyranella sp.]OJU45344.1 MAG: hypothetical protein BGN99_29705 [Alphaproteobacteria bacterium 65-37]